MHKNGQILSIFIFTLLLKQIFEILNNAKHYSYRKGREKIIADIPNLNFINTQA